MKCTDTLGLLLNHEFLIVFATQKARKFMSSLGDQTFTNFVPRHNEMNKKNLFLQAYEAL
jgi:hypothetical protein